MPVPNVGQNYAANREALIAALRNQPYQNPFGPAPPAALSQPGPIARFPEEPAYPRYPLAQPRLGAGGVPGIIPPPTGLPPGAVARQAPLGGAGIGPRQAPPLLGAPAVGRAPLGGAPPLGGLGAAPLVAPAPIAAARTPANIDTDNYAAPRVMVPMTGPAPPGFSGEKWRDPSHQTPKYAVGRIIFGSGLAPRTENMDAIVAKIAEAYPGARRVGSGDVHIPGVGTMDILVGADVGGKRWHAGSAGGGGGGAKGAGGKGGGVPGITAYDPSNLTSSSALADIIRSIQGIAGSGGNLATNRDALMAVLQGA